MSAVRSTTSPDAIRYMRANAGIGVHYIDVANAIHAPKTHVNNALVRVVNKHPEMGIRRIGMGQYIFKPDYQMNGAEPEPEPKKEEPMYYEFVGQTQDGTIIVRDENSVLYRLSDKL
jgi:hypothetical protein